MLYGDVHTTKNALPGESRRERITRYGWDISPIGCWLWRGARTDSGYGVLWFSRRLNKVHRLAYEEWVGPIPKGLIVRHRCDVRECINPEHLETGTHLDNTHDMDERGRRVNAPRYGEDAGNSKLTWEKVRWIRASYSGQRGEKALFARKLGVQQSSIANVLENLTWKENPDDTVTIY